jgi:hypothetical protein
LKDSLRGELRLTSIFQVSIQEGQHRAAASVWERPGDRLQQRRCFGNNASTGQLGFFGCAMRVD